LALWQKILIAIGATAAAWLARLALSPVLLDQGPYHLFFISVLITGLLAGWQLSVLAAIAGGVIANINFVPPYGHFALSGRFGWGFVLYFVTAALIIWLTHSMTRALNRESDLSQRLRTVSDEYRHRIKNSLAMAQALVSQTARHTLSIAEFEDKIVARFQALSRAQDLLSDPSERSVPIRRFLDEILTPFGIEGRMAWPPSGPEVQISSDTTVSLALIFNELATNATKYGALSVPAGRIKLDWAVQGSWLIIEWRECDGPAVTAPAKRGFGSRLFDQAMPRASGKTALAFQPDGLTCEIRLAVDG
jgi:two-component sensor histidine kinase